MRVLILMFDAVDVLDFAGPFEVFSVANDVQKQLHFDVQLVSEHGGAVTARGGLRVNVNYSYTNAPQADVLIVPGGDGRKQQMRHTPTLNFVRKQTESAFRVASVCTGAFILAHAGVLEPIPVATYHDAYDEFAQTFPWMTLARGQRYVEGALVWTSAGVSAGIDLSLALLDHLVGPGIGSATATAMEYDRRVALPATEQ